MPVSLEERLLLRRLGMDPAFSNDQFHGGLYGQPDAMSSGGAPMMQQNTRDWRALGGGGNTPSPTRMSQPVIGGQIGPDANDISQQAKAADYQSQLDNLKAIGNEAGPLWNDLPSSKEEAFNLLLQRGHMPGRDGEVANWMAGNLGSDPLQRYEARTPVYSDEKRADLATQQKVSQGNRAADLATRRNAVSDRARRKGEARDMRMGDGGTIMADKQMQMLQALSGGGSGGPAAMGPSGGYPSPEALVMLYGPEVGTRLAEQRRLGLRDSNDATNAKSQLEIQRQQQEYMKQKLAAEAGDAAVMSLPPDMRALPGHQLMARNGRIDDKDILQYVQHAIGQGMNDRDQLLSHLASKGFYDPTQNARVIQGAMGGQPVAPAEQGPEFDWYKSLTDAMSGNMQPSGIQFRGGF